MDEDVVGGARPALDGKAALAGGGEIFPGGDGREKGAIEAEGWRGGEFVGEGRAGFGDG